MKNMQTLKHFMRYFEPHCEERDGRKYCYVSALEYPEAQEALDLFGGYGFFRRSAQLHYPEVRPPCRGGR